MTPEQRTKKESIVSRSVYQKVVEENKRLLIDIKILTDEKQLMTVGRIFTVKKWRDKFAKDKEFNKMISEACKQYLKEHPEFKIPMIPAKLDSNKNAFK